MLKSIYRYTVLSALPAILILQGCASYSTFQSVEVMEPGEGAWGMGITGGIDSDLNTYKDGNLTELYGRFNLKKNWDMGLKMSGFLPVSGVYLADVKYQVLSRPFYVSGDLGLSYSHLYRKGRKDIGIFGLHPMIMAGTKRVYCGIKVVSLVSTGSVELYGSPYRLKNSIAYPGLFFGGNIGNEFKIMPEFHIYFPNESGAEPFKMWGIGFQFAISR
jgi:hypothetical protein